MKLRVWHCVLACRLCGYFPSYTLVRLHLAPSP